MTFLPYEDLTYKTHLSKDEIVKRLRNENEPKQLTRIGTMFGGHKEYEGSINEDSFEINRIIGYKNLFLPQIKGYIREEKGNTIIYIKMNFHTWVFIFIAIWMGIVIVMSPTFSTLFYQDLQDSFQFTIPIIMMITVPYYFFRTQILRIKQIKRQ